MESPDRIGCVVLSIREGRESVVLLTSDGEIEIEVAPLTTKRSRVVVRAPVSIEIRRRKKAVIL